MDAMTGYISAHPTLFAAGVILVVIIILTFIVKSMVKLFIAILIIGMIAFGYFYFNNSGDTSKPAGESVEFMKSGIDQFRDKSKSFMKDSKDLYNRTKSAPKEVDKMLDSSGKEMDKELKK